MILITGGSGQLGRHIGTLLGSNAKLLSSADLNLTEGNSVSRALDELRPELVINCGAYTAVDLAETDYKNALDVNAVAVGRLASETQRRNVKLIHISTDYVFSEFTSPISETAEPKPVNAYGESKRQGEVKLLENTDRGLIIRTGWLYSAFGKNFLNSMIKLGTDREEIGVVYDQIGTPTFAGDLASVIVKLARDHDFKTSDVFHYSNEGTASWYDFAQQIFKLWALKGCVRPILTHEYPTPAKRPSYSVLDKAKIKSTFDLRIPHWTESLELLSRLS